MHAWMCREATLWQVWIREGVLEELDHHNIDLEVEPFRSGTVSQFLLQAVQINRYYYPNLRNDLLLTERSLQ